MGTCHGKIIQRGGEAPPEPRNDESPQDSSQPRDTPTHLPTTPQKNSPSHSSFTSSSLQAIKRSFPPPSPAKHIKAFLARRHGSVKPTETPIPEGCAGELVLDKNFGYSKSFFSRYEMGDEVGRGHFGFTASAMAKNGKFKGQQLAVKVIPKAKVRLFVSTGNHIFQNLHCSYFKHLL